MACRPKNDGYPVDDLLVQATARGIRVLVVDDNVDAAHTLQELLSHLGHESVVAHDGFAALELAHSFRPQVAMLDIGLPVMDGHQLARRLRAQHVDTPLRLIALTGYGQGGDRSRAEDAGFDHHLVKPVDLEALMPRDRAPRLGASKGTHLQI